MSSPWWCMYYDDGSTFTDADGAPHESPVWGVVAVAHPGEVLYGANADYFLYRTDLGRWHQCGETEREGAVGVGLIDHLAHFAHVISAVRPARWMPDYRQYQAIYLRAYEDAHGE